jgi:hypothetical protein
MNSQVEAAFAQWISGLVNSAPVYTGSSATEMDVTDLAIVVTVPQVEFVLYQLHKATVEILIGGPAFHASLSSYRNVAAEVLAPIQSQDFGALATALAPIAAFRGIAIQDSAESQTDDSWTHTIRLVCGLETEVEAEPWPEPATDDYFDAAANLSGGRFVYLSGSSASYANASTSLPAMGFIKQAVTSGDSVKVYRQGRLDGLAGLTADRDYYLGANGQPTLTPSTASGIIQFLGRSISTDVILVEIDSPISAT